MKIEHGSTELLCGEWDLLAQPRHSQRGKQAYPEMLGYNSIGISKATKGFVCMHIYIYLHGLFPTTQIEVRGCSMHMWDELQYATVKFT